MHILLAEDDKISRDLLRRIIEAESHTVTLAEDGEAAWNVLNESPGAFDACIFDICMPTTSGIDLVERMRVREELKRIPVILCSAVSDRSTVQKAAALGVTHYIVKPYSRALMHEKLRLIKAHQAPQTEAGLLEPAEIVCRRLGIEAAVYRDMVATIIEDAADWAWELRAAQDRAAIQRLFIRGRGLKGSCLSIGVRGAAQKIEPVEKLLQMHVESLAQPPPPLAREAIEALLLELDREAQAARTKLKLPRAQTRSRSAEMPPAPNSAAAAAAAAETEAAPSSAAG